MDKPTRLIFYIFHMTVYWIVICHGQDLDGIIYATITVDNMDKAVSFYTDIMGGMKIEKFSIIVSGDSHFYSMFQKEILEANDLNVNLDTFGVPDISSNGDMEVNIMYLT